ncbi:nitroreductase/quinone reductase family protein [Pseudonocardia sp. TRM90224]|uniref:nitroreductase/quinone reductase family protein n=1 Tax=Pseudonocardia sp. TRM90224 TaxID=2812678 RepID=UPI001E551B18|nr:nitroreductase/quinone reductase family protein [Pseudonocardia sp. TRM90224]
MATGTLPGWLKPMNKFVRVLAWLNLPLGSIHVLTVPGRTSGKPRTTPISPMTFAGRRYLVAALSDGDWARNVRAAGRGVLARGHRKRSVELPEVTDPAQRRAVVAAFPTEVPTGIPFFQRLGMVKDGTPEEFAAIADDVAVFEIRT